MYLLFLHSFFHNSETWNSFALHTATDFRFSNCEKQLHHRLDTFFMILSQNVTLRTRDHVVFGCGLSYLMIDMLPTQLAVTLIEAYLASVVAESQVLIDPPTSSSSDSNHIRKT